MISDVLKPGNRVELVETVYVDEKVQKRTYVSQICDVDDDNEDIIFILMPVYEGKLVPLSLDKEFEAFISNAKGIHRCEVVVKKRFKTENIYMIMLEIVSDIKRYQRREYFRLEISKPFEFVPYSMTELEYYLKNRELPDSVRKKGKKGAVTLDISGGGIRYVTKERNTKYDIIRVSFPVELAAGTKILDFFGKVLSTNILPDRTGIYEERIEFYEIAKNEREDIIKYIFEEERKRRRKEHS